MLCVASNRSVCLWICFSHIQTLWFCNVKTMRFMYEGMGKVQPSVPTQSRYISLAGVNAPVWHTAPSGDSVTINCTYLPTEDVPIKHFYRENPDSDATDLISMHTSPKTMKDRFSLTDHKEQGVYTVMISSPTQEDTARYRCAQRTVTHNFTTCLTRIHLYIVGKYWSDFNHPHSKLTNTTQSFTHKTLLLQKNMI